jgi:hypothetical protein
MTIRYFPNYNMIGNLNVTLEIEKNSQEELEVNGLTRRVLINNSQLGKPQV